MASNYKTRLEHLQEATPEEMLDELRRRRVESLQDCSDQEIETELKTRGVDRDVPPRLVEK